MRNPMLVGERVYLRPLEVSDAEAMARASAEEADTAMLRLRVPESPLHVESYIAHLYDDRWPEAVAFAVCRRADDRLIGSVDLEDIDWVNRTAETGSWLLWAEDRGQGYGTEAKHLLLEYAFDHLHLHVLLSGVWEPNRRSAAALAKQGYRPAGRMKWHDLKDGAYRDLLIFDLTRADWLAARAAARATG